MEPQTVAGAARGAPSCASHEQRVRPPSPTLLCALERAAGARAPLFTMHLGGEPVAVDAAAALDGAFAFARLLHREGVRGGDRVLLLLATSPAFVHALLGTMMLGAVPAPLASPMTFGGVERYLQNLRAIVKDSGARCLVTERKLRDAVAGDDELRQSLTSVVVPDEASGLGPGPTPLPSVDAAEPALLQYTSGTTGRPKGAVISHRALVHNALAIAEGLGLSERDVGVSWLPMFHDMGLIGVVLTAVCHPYPVHLIRPEAFVFRPSRWLDLVAEVGGTISAGPNFAYELCVAKGAAAEGRLDSWRLALNGAEPVFASTVQRFEATFRDRGLRQGVSMPVYGMAESTLAVTFPDRDGPRRVLPVDRDALVSLGKAVPGLGASTLDAVSVGRPVLGAKVRVVLDGAVVPERTVGEIEVSGPSLMDGYFRNDEATALALAGGWLKSGDLGFFDGGELFVVGRKKDVVIKGGRNYYPFDIERIAVEAAPGAAAVAAFARPNPRAGTDDLVVLVEHPARGEEDRERIVKAVRGELLAALGVKADEIQVRPVGSLPRTTSGKIRRAACLPLVSGGGDA